MCQLLSSGRLLKSLRQQHQHQRALIAFSKILQDLIALTLLAVGRLGPDTMCCGENWSADISCYPGYTSCCYDMLGCFGVEATMQTMWDYAVGLTAPRAPAPRDGVWMVQGHWQYDPEAWAKGQVHSSSICLDEHRSGVNAGIAVSSLVPPQTCAPHGL